MFTSVCIQQMKCMWLLSYGSRTIAISIMRRFSVMSDECRRTLKRLRESVSIVSGTVRIRIFCRSWWGCRRCRKRRQRRAFHHRGPNAQCAWMSMRRNVEFFPSYASTESRSVSQLRFLLVSVCERRFRDGDDQDGIFVERLITQSSVRICIDVLYGLFRAETWERLNVSFVIWLKMFFCSCSNLGSGVREPSKGMYCGAKGVSCALNMEWG